MPTGCAALAEALAGVPRGLGLRGAVVDDPQLAEVVHADDDLIERGVVIHRVDVGPVRIDSLRPLRGGPHIADRLEASQYRPCCLRVFRRATLLAARLSRRRTCRARSLWSGCRSGYPIGFSTKLMSTELGMRGDLAVVGLGRIVILDKGVVPQVPFPRPHPWSCQSV